MLGEPSWDSSVAADRGMMTPEILIRVRLDCGRPPQLTENIHEIQ
jgi:hypothetical protein